MANMYEFYCHTDSCYANWLITEYDDPTSSSGCCKICGSNNWTIKETDLTETEYFKSLLKDPDQIIQYSTGTYMAWADPKVKCPRP